MNLNNLSAKKICRLVSAGMVFSMLVITGIFGGIMQDIRIFIVGGTLTLCAFFWIWLLVLIFGKRLSHFTSNLCRTLDNMIDGNEELQKSNDSETLFARINHRLIRLYEIMQKNRHKVDMERQELQMLISDISHQVKTPVSNLQMVTDTLLTKPVSEEERMDFLQGIRSQTDKLDFLFQALVKTSRLETGAIRLEKKDSSLFHTLAQAMSSIVYAAEKKEIAVSVDCPENLIISHDSKWTSEALFNLLDNAVASASEMESTSFIDLRIRHLPESSCTLISLINSCPSSPYDALTGTLSTKKKNKMRHGYGMRSVSRVVKAHQGNMDLYYDDESKTFHTTVQFPDE